MTHPLPQIKNGIIPLGSYSTGSTVYLYVLKFRDGLPTATIDKSSDGVTFVPSGEGFAIKTPFGEEDLTKCSNFRISHIDSRYTLTYIINPNQQAHVCLAVSDDLKTWTKLGKILASPETAMVVPDTKVNDQYVLISGEKSIKVSFSKDLKHWAPAKNPIIAKTPDHFDNAFLKVATVKKTADGIIILYYVKRTEHGNHYYAINTALVDSSDPTKLIWNSKFTIWEQTDHWTEKSVHPVGISEIGDSLLSFWGSENTVFTILHTPIKKVLSDRKNISFLFLKRIKENPILKPIVEHFWESKAVFNPAAIYEGGKVHLVYRAIGDHDRSMLGYASSSDGMHIDERLSEPCYVPTEPFEGNAPSMIAIPDGMTAGNYISGGGGAGGVEDPRLTKIDDTLYMTYVAYDGWTGPRVALTSIKTKDFLEKKWTWAKPVLVSPPGVIDKNCVLFPEKINGKYVMYHRIYPNMLVDYLDDLDFDGETKFLKYKGDAIIPPRRTSWDSRKIGAGAPPIKTPYGWLTIYHSVGDQDPSRYKMGAMLADLKDPAKILYRSRNPILEPNAIYENEGMKYGVAYPCGAAQVGDDLFVYYGGADMVVCAARANMNEFLSELINGGTMHLTPAQLSTR